MPLTNGFACPGACFRSVFFEYYEDSFIPGFRGTDTTKILYNVDDLSKLVIVREEDGAMRVVDGVLLYDAKTGGKNLRRWAFVNLLANLTYTVYITPPARNASFWPSTLRFFYVDGWDGQKPCRGWVKLRVLPQYPTSGQWAIVNSDNAWWRPCPGVGGLRTWPFEYEASCYSGKISLLITLSLSLPSRVSINLVSTNASVQTCDFAVLPCGALASGESYRFNTSGQEQRFNLSQALQYQMLGFNDSAWDFGPAIIGFVQYTGPWMDTKTVNPGTVKGVRRTTFYFRRTFSVANVSCFPGMIVEFLPYAGTLVFLNGVEVFRYLLPAGNITAATFATNASVFTKVPVFNTVTVSLTGAGNPSLNVGDNVLAYETHTFRPDTYTMYFDSRVSFLSSC